MPQCSIFWLIAELICFSLNNLVKCFPHSYYNCICPLVFILQFCSTLFGLSPQKFSLSLHPLLLLQSGSSFYIRKKNCKIMLSLKQTVIISITVCADRQNKITLFNKIITVMWKVSISKIKSMQILDLSLQLIKQLGKRFRKGKPLDIGAFQI